MRPELTPAALTAFASAAEARFYRACQDSLPEQLLVLHSVAVVRRSGPGRRAEDAEADFVICDPALGILVVEVKGGGVAFDPTSGTWTSVDRLGNRHAIKDPFRQATGAKYLMLEQLKAHRRWATTGIRRVNIGHAVALPDISQIANLTGPASPREIVGGRADLDRFETWVRDALRFWAGEDPSGEPLGAVGLALVEEVFCHPFEVRPLLRDVLEDEETARITLTQQQSRLLRALGTRRRAAISGGAGTGKTLIAFERARELADMGRRTLLVCYNRPLANFLRRQPSTPANL